MIPPKTSYGQTLLRKYLKAAIPFDFIENSRPDFMMGLEFDFYYPEHKLAFEFNGDQHYFKTDFGDPSKQKFNDARKYRLCKDHGITMVTLEAIDLEYTKLNGKINRLNIFNTKKLREHVKTVKVELRAFNKEATDYRKTLISSYNAPSARKHGSAVRQAAIAATDPNNVVFSTEKDYKVIRDKTLEDARAERKAINKIARNDKKLLDLIENIFET